jgi:hypothetical protein
MPCVKCHGMGEWRDNPLTTSVPCSSSIEVSLSIDQLIISPEDMVKGDIVEESANCRNSLENGS